MEGRSLAELQRAAIQRMTECVIRTRRREEELVTARDTAVRSSEKRITALRESAGSRFTAAVAAAERAWADAHRQAEERFDGEIAATEREERAMLEQVEQRSTTRVAEASTARQEAIWLAETVFEATSNQPQEKHDQHLRAVAGFRQEFDRIEADAARWIAACRMPEADEPAPSDFAADDADRRAAEAAGTLASKPELERCADVARESLAALRAQRGPRVFRSGAPVVLALVPAVGAAAAALLHRGGTPGPESTTTVAVAAGLGLLAGIVLLVVLHIVLRRSVLREHQRLRGAVALGRQAAIRCERESGELRDRQMGELVARRDADIRHAEQSHGPILEQIAQRRVRRLAEIRDRYPAAIERLRKDRAEAIASLAARREAALADAEARRVAELAEGERAHAEAVATATETFRREWATLTDGWRRETGAAWSDLLRVRETIEQRFPAWDDPSWSSFAMPRDFPPALPYGRHLIDLAALEGGLPAHPDLALPGPPSFEVPALLDFPEQASLLIRAAGAGLEGAVPLLQVAMFRLLTALPAAKVRLTIIDPVGLGQNFAGFMHLADDDGAIVTDRIWTEDRHIDQRLLDLTEHMENVIQKYLRNEYETIGQYNVDAGEVAEPYRFLVVANLPVNFSESASRRLMSVVASGPRCGVFTLITADTRAATPPGLQMDDIARGSTALRMVDQAATGSIADGAAATASFAAEDPVYAPWPLRLDSRPPETLVTAVLRVVGRESKEASRVEVPFRMIAPPGPWPVDPEADDGGEATGATAGTATGASAGTATSTTSGASRADGSPWWSRSSASELRVPMGRAGATKLQDLALGQGVSQHVLIAGKTGSGKSTLLHALVTNIALWYPPGEVEFYLVDFKKGVEFKTYAANDLPHARAVAIESDREFGLSVLQRLDAELRRRGELYRDLGVQDLAGYRRAVADDAAAERLPRTLLVIDEFQEFFTEDDKIGQDATLLLDRLVRQGRAFGIHVILGSQTLGGAYSLARSTIGQMAVRIALQCTESDSYLILSDDNAAARLLSRPGEAIYNDQGGLIEGNSPFQIAWLNDDDRDRYLAGVRTMARRRGVGRSEPLIVFEGNIPADLERNAPLAQALAAAGGAEPARRHARGSAAPRAWLGDAIAIKDPTAAVLRRQSGSNVLIVGQRDEAAVGMLVASTVGILAQRPDATVLLFDGLPPDAPEAGQLERLAELLPGMARSIAWRDAAEAIGMVHGELRRRADEDAADAPPIVLCIAGLARYRMLRQEDDFGFSGDADAPPSTEKQFGAILREGPLAGIHVIAWVDTFNNLGRALDRQAMKEFEQRVLFQMGQSDSSSLIDSPAASRLGLHRALFFSEEAGTLEKFRPYALPDRSWLERTCAALRAARPGDQSAATTWISTANP
ncbi:MAG TPA: FtsK/SpoIIIE domain-containing protein [Phycisphaerales bacterium]|nr:FtsK/SpoIIIE domain-containing protein [Phycisphaerales bacterium]HMP38298.1 FtsK/SpoIIIE domain-containing protein [Phycisphaerales bacterium]